MDEKTKLRARMRQARREHVATLPDMVRRLVFNRPPAPVAQLMPEGATIGLYHATAAEAPTLGWARWLAENGRTLALPGFANRDSAMAFRRWDNPWDDDSLETGPFGALQPASGSGVVVPDVLVVPLLAFAADGARLGQGGGHYDRWLAAHPHTPAIGLAWDCQRAERLPLEPHDQRLRAVVTPTRFYEFESASR